MSAWRAFSNAIKLGHGSEFFFCRQRKVPAARFTSGTGALRALVNASAVLLFVAPRLLAVDAVPIGEHGPSLNRIDFVFVAEGYQQSELDSTFTQHIDNALQHIFSAGEDPYPRYRNFFNIWRVDLVSNESGADKPPLGIERDTALDATYYSSGIDRLLTVDSSKLGSELRLAFQNQGEARPDYVATLVNDETYGGAGQFDTAVASAGNFWAGELLLHEGGHSWHDLADEYGGDPSTYSGGELSEINVTNDPTGARWSEWLGYSEPGMGVIGAYQGGRYFDKGIYRPSNNSKMRTLGQKFDAVSREKIIRDIYAKVDPLDSWTNNQKPLSDPSQLQVKTVDSEVIKTEWKLGNRILTDFSTEHLDLADLALPLGQYTLSARAFDDTPWVRRGKSALEQNIAWTVNITKQTMLAGDIDGDNQVGLFDFAILRSQFGRETFRRSRGDLNADGQVSFLDFAILRSNFNARAQMVSEPTASLGMAALILYAAARKKRRFLT